MKAPSLDGVLEAAVYVDDLDAAEAFYGGVLGLERITRQGARHVFFRCGESVVLAFNPKETVIPPGEGQLPVPPHGATGPGHICFATEGDEIERLSRELPDQGVDVESDFRWPHGPRSIYVRDPAGNSVEFAEPSLWARRA